MVFALRELRHRLDHNAAVRVYVIQIAKVASAKGYGFHLWLQAEILQDVIQARAPVEVPADHNVRFLVERDQVVKPVGDFTVRECSFGLRLL